MLDAGKDVEKEREENRKTTETRVTWRCERVGQDERICQRRFITVK